MAEQFSKRTFTVRRSDLEVMTFTATLSIDVSSGGSYIEYIYAPENTICYADVMAFWTTGLPNATSGTHQIEFGVMGLAALQGISNYTDIVRFYCGHFRDATNAAYPPTDTAQSVLTRNNMFTANYPITLSYINNTDGSYQRGIFYVIGCKRQVI